MLLHPERKIIFQSFNDFAHIPWEDTPNFPKTPQRKEISSTAGETSGGIFRGYVGGILESSRVRLAVYMQVVGWLGYLDLNLKPRTSTWNDLQTLGFSNSKFPEYFKSNLTIPSEK